MALRARAVSDALSHPAGPFHQHDVEGRAWPAQEVSSHQRTAGAAPDNGDGRRARVHVATLSNHFHSFNRNAPHLHLRGASRPATRAYGHTAGLLRPCGRLVLRLWPIGTSYRHIKRLYGYNPRSTTLWAFRPYEPASSATSDVPPRVCTAMGQRRPSPCHDQERCNAPNVQCPKTCKCPKT
jgi:hypothetical protein